MIKISNFPLTFSSLYIHFPLSYASYLALLTFLLAILFLSRVFLSKASSPLNQYFLFNNNVQDFWIPPPSFLVYPSLASLWSRLPFFFLARWMSGTKRVRLPTRLGIDPFHLCEMGHPCQWGVSCSWFQILIGTRSTHLS